MNPELMRVLRSLDVAAARKLYPMWMGSLKGTSDDTVLRAMHQRRLHYSHRFTRDERIASQVWLLWHGATKAIGAAT